MRELFYTLALLFAASTLFISCGDNEVTNPISVESVTITPSGFSIAMGAPATTLTATVHPSNATNRAVAWASDNPNIASVNAQTGAVTAVSVGQTYIRVITACGAHTNRATVTVTPAPIAVTGVTIAGCNPDTPLAINATRQLTATVLPADATNRAVTWSSNNTNAATVDNNGLVTARAAGTATITVTTADGNRTATCIITIVACNIDNPAGVVINGIRWATRNVDMPGTFAPHPESAGRFFQWGTLNGAVHHWAATGTVTGWNNSSNRVAWTAANDPCPPGWRVPTQAELTNLRNQPHTWTQRNGVSGRLFGTAPNQLFLPAAGHRSTGGSLWTVGNWGCYWSSSANDACSGWWLNFCSVSSAVHASNRAVGFSVRCVSE